MAYITAGQQGAGVAPVLREAAPPASRRCMAAMAPALTDAPAEARHIRFKLAPPPSAANLLLSSARKEERCARDFQDLPAEAAGAGPRAKLQPLVASYLCSDVTSVPSTKDSLALQGVLIKQTVLQARADFLPDSYFDGGDFLPRKAQLKGPVAASGQPALNGLARKLAKPGPDRDRTVSTVNGDRPGPGRATPPPAQPPPARGDPLKAGPPPDGVPDGREAPTTALACGVELGGAGSRCSPLPSAPGDGPALLPAPAPPCPDEEVRDRARQSRARQGEMEGRLRRLRKRLQVVQAKQVERHVQQQLRCLLSSALPPDAPPRPHAAALLRSGSVPAQLERLSLSGAAHLRSAEAAFDSDATVSSSGGESDVEEEQLATPDLEKRHVSLWRRAEGRVALQRASIISHWNWLQAHISDLEYRIRQQTDIYRQVRSNKGLIVLGDSAPCEVSLEDGAEVKAEPVPCHVTQERGSGGTGGSDADAGQWKGWTPGKPVNGVLNSLLPASPESSDTEEQLAKKQRLQPLSSSSSSSSSSSPDASCTAARTRPVLSCKKRRLVRPNALANLNRKAQRLGPRCGCEVSPSCLMCGGRASLPVEPQYESPLLDRLSQFDSCIHPILSFDDDVSVVLLLQGALKAHWQCRPLEKSKPLKKLALKHKLSGRVPDPSSCSSSSKDKHKLAGSLMAAVRVSHHPLRQDQRQQQRDRLLSASKLKERGRAPGHGPYHRGGVRKRPRERSLDRPDPSSKLYLDACGPCPSNSQATPSHSPLLRQLSTSSDNSAPFALNSQSTVSTPPIRRRRGESSFDINNIVIPMSVAATTRVEKLQYKEILTPSWREVNVCARPIAEEDDAVEVEDLSDVVIGQLHQLCEDQERSRWSWTASAMARRGSRSYKSLDGRSTPLLGGTTPSTPQPSSPDPAHFPSLQDYGPPPSPCSPHSPDLPPLRLGWEDTRCSTPECSYEELIPQPVQPWECRTFPLEDDPAAEPQDLGSLTPDWPVRGPHRVSVSKSENSPASPDPTPSPGSAPSPSPDDGCRQKPLPLLRPSPQ